MPSARCPRQPLTQAVLLLATALYGRVRSEPLYPADVYGYGGRVRPQVSADQCLSTNCCYAAKETCSLSALPKDSTTLVFPAGNTRCIFSTSTPFSFQVIPSSSDKLLLYFQGGGACWDKISTHGGFCTTDAVPDELVGIFNHSDASNPYKDYTVVQVLYCSGDLHAGNVTQNYDDSVGEPVVQTGINNVQSVIEWIVSQQKTGEFAEKLTDLVLMGCSAGSIGTQIWATEVMRAVSWTSAAVIPDSYVGVFPPGSQGPLIYDFGMCPWFSSWATSSLSDMCYSKTLTLQDITEYQISTVDSWGRDVPFSFIQSKEDAVQISFYITIGALDPTIPANITSEEFYAQTNLIFERYNAYQNFVHYFVDGPKHCFTEEAVVFRADNTGPAGSKNPSVQEMIDWIGLMPLTSSPVETQCYGQELEAANWTGTEYCDSALQGKSYGP